MLVVRQWTHTYTGLRFGRRGLGLLGRSGRVEYS